MYTACGVMCCITECGLELLNTPFRCCQMQNFIRDEHFLEGLRDELSDLICYEKNNDLYKFHQVRDATVFNLICTSG